jgi:hypothetical protein
MLPKYLNVQIKSTNPKKRLLIFLRGKLFGNESFYDIAPDENLQKAENYLIKLNSMKRGNIPFWQIF